MPAITEASRLALAPEPAPAPAPARTLTSPSELRSDWKEHRLRRFLPPRAVSPPLVGISHRGGQVTIEDVGHLLREGRIVDIQAGFVIEFKGAHVEIR